MLRAAHLRTIGTVVAILLVLVLAMAAGALVWDYPTIVAALCPSCYGMERVSDDIFVEPELSAEARANLQSAVMQAEANVTAFYGAFGGKPIVLACATRECYRRFGGGGSAATTFSTPWFAAIRVSPRGESAMFFTHEFSHVELHRRIGLEKQLSGAVAAWFNEGLAAVVSNDDRYLNPGSTVAERCRQDTPGVLPVRERDWTRAAGSHPTLYATAACRVLKWMDANGGRAGLISALDDVRAGKRTLP